MCQKCLTERGNYCGNCGAELKPLCKVCGYREPKGYAYCLTKMQEIDRAEQEAVAAIGHWRLKLLSTLMLVFGFAGVALLATGFGFPIFPGKQPTAYGISYIISGGVLLVAGSVLAWFPDIWQNRAKQNVRRNFYAKNRKYAEFKIQAGETVPA